MERQKFRFPGYQDGLLVSDRLNIALTKVDSFLPQYAAHATKKTFSLFHGAGLTIIKKCFVVFYIEKKKQGSG